MKASFLWAVVAAWLAGCAGGKVSGELAAAKMHAKDLESDLNLCLQERAALLSVFRQAGQDADLATRREK